MDKLNLAKWMAAVLLGVSALGCGQGLGSRLEFNGGELYYTSQVTKQEAQKLGECLVEQDFFDGKEKSVQLDKEGETYVFRAVVKKELQENIANNATLDPVFKFIALGMSVNVFGGSPVEIHLCDGSFKTLRVISMEK